ncbi:hypothetical protein ACG04R_06170 [Roseateles sp. BYS78W]|uniref:GGDEF domain-containing protein n=2 Tax=Pelomonas candidula TaxID=3299025 RepID=A0ABW7H8V1_9BURK
MNWDSHHDVIRRLLSRVSPSGWRWQPVEGTAGPAWELVQDGAAPSEVFALGEVLSGQARLIAAFTPSVLSSLETAEEQRLEAAERLEQASLVLRRHLRRCHRLKQQEHYEDLRQLTQLLSGVLENVGASVHASSVLLEALEEAQLVHRTG